MVSCILINGNKNAYKERSKECIPSINIKISQRSWNNKLATFTSIVASATKERTNKITESSLKNKQNRKRVAVFKNFCRKSKTAMHFRS